MYESEKMTTVTMMELRQHSDRVIRRAKRGQHMILTYRGNPVMRLEPYQETTNTDISNDAFYSLGKLADADCKNINNTEIDRLVYG